MQWGIVFLFYMLEPFRQPETWLKYRKMLGLDFKLLQIFAPTGVENTWTPVAMRIARSGVRSFDRIRQDDSDLIL